jgi:hypothetical protein
MCINVHLLSERVRVGVISDGVKNSFLHVGAHVTLYLFVLLSVWPCMSMLEEAKYD